MKVKDKVNGNVYQVYDISYDRSGYPHFLIYKDNQWVRKSAKYFTPTAKERIRTSITDNFDLKSTQEFLEMVRSTQGDIRLLAKGGTISYNDEYCEY